MTPIDHPAAKSCSGPPPWPAAASLPRTASAQAKGRIVVGTWGGDYARLLNKNIAVPLLIMMAGRWCRDQAGDPERRSKMLRRDAAGRAVPIRLCRGFRPVNMFQMHDARQRSADRLRQIEKCRQSACRRMKLSYTASATLYFGQGRRLQSQDRHDRAGQLQGRV